MTPEVNPYQAPASEVSPGPDPVRRGREPASRWRRFFTFLVDYVCFVLLSMVIGAVIGLTLGQRGVQAMQSVPNFVLGSAFFFAYYGFFEGLWARTPGKWLLGTIVVSEDGTKPSLGQVLGRTACRFIPFEALTFFGAVGLHDRLPKTRVVRYSQDS